MDRVVVTLMFYLLTIAGIVECQRCSGRVITAAKDECTLAINNMRRVGSSSIACKPGECREQLRAGFASGACTVLMRVMFVFSPGAVEARVEETKEWGEETLAVKLMLCTCS